MIKEEAENAIIAIANGHENTIGFRSGMRRIAKRQLILEEAVSKVLEMCAFSELQDKTLHDARDILADAVKRANSVY